MACKALYEGTAGILNKTLAAKLIKESFWNPEECLKFDCMRDFNLPLFCKDEMMELANQHDGKGLEGIKALGVDAEIEKDAGLHEEGPSCTSCTSNINKQMACKALYKGEVGILNRHRLRNRSRSPFGSLRSVSSLAVCETSICHSSARMR